MRTYALIAKFFIILLCMHESPLINLNIIVVCMEKIVYLVGIDVAAGCLFWFRQMF